jgi:hypothetical protein
MSSGAAKYQGVPIVEDTKKAGAIAILDASTAIAGDLPLVRAAIDRRGGGSGLNASLAARIEPLRSQYSVWGTGTLPARPPAQSGDVDPIASVDQFEFGARFGQGVELTADVHARTAADAEKMASSLALAQTMLKSSDSSGSKFEMTTEDQWLKLKVSIPQEALTKMVEAQRTALQSALTSRLGMGMVSPSPRTPRKPQAPPAPKIVTDKNGDTLTVTLPGKH